MRLIDADALKIPSTSVDMFENCRNCRLLDEEQVREIIDNAPTIDAVEGVRGKWINKTIPVSMANPYGGIIVGIACSVCGYDGENEQLGKISNRIIERFNFCPNCGAKMKGADDETR